MFWCVLMCEGVSWCVLGVSWCIKVCSGVSGRVLDDLGVPWCVLLCSGVSWCVQVCPACSLCDLGVSWVCLECSWRVLVWTWEGSIRVFSMDTSWVYPSDSHGFVTGVTWECHRRVLEPLRTFLELSCSCCRTVFVVAELLP